MGAVVQQLMSYGASAPAPTTGLLDGHTTSLWAARGLALLITGYAGPLVRIRDSTTTTEYDIYPASGGTGIDTSAISANIGSNSATVTTVYDQSGNGRNWVQATTTKQPRIVNAGVYDGKLVFDGSNDCMTTSVGLSGTATINVHIYGNLRSTSATTIVMEQSADFGANSVSWAVYCESSTYKTVTASLAGGSSQSKAYGTALANDVWGHQFDNTAATGANSASYNGGALLASTRNVNASMGSSNFTNYALNLGSRNNGASLASQLDWKADALYSDGRTPTEILQINTALAF